MDVVTAPSIERREHDARRRRRRADHALHEERHVGDRPEHRHADQPMQSDARRARSRFCRTSNGRIGSSTRRSHEPNTTARTTADARARRSPAASPTRTALPPQTSPSRSEVVAGREQSRADPVDRAPDHVAAARHREPDDDERDPADGQVHVEDPAPARVVDDEAADRRADDRRRRERRRRSAPGSGRGRAAGRCCRSPRARAGSDRRRRAPGPRGR